MSSGAWAPAPHVRMALPRYSLQSAFTDIIMLAPKHPLKTTINLSRAGS